MEDPAVEPTDEARSDDSVAEVDVVAAARGSSRTGRKGARGEKDDRLLFYLFSTIF